MKAIAVASDRQFDVRKPSLYSQIAEASTPQAGTTSQPHAYLDSGTTSQHLQKPKRKKKSASEKLSARYLTRQKTVQFLYELGYDDEAETMSRCSEKVLLIRCENNHIAAKKEFHRCGIRYCPTCANRRAGKYQNKFLPRAQSFIEKLRNEHRAAEACLLTLTQKKIKGESITAARDRILKSFRKLIRREFFEEYFAGGIWANESTFSADGVHCHLHCVVFRKKFVNHKLLKDHWAAVSPGATNLNIKRIEDLAGGLRECIKYLAKLLPADQMKREYISQLLKLKGKRMIDSFGEFKQHCQKENKKDKHRVAPEPAPSDHPKVEVGQPCACCGATLFEETRSALELIEFYRRREHSSKSLPRGRPPMLH